MTSRRFVIGIFVAATLAVPALAHAFEGVLHMTATIEGMGTIPSTIHVRENGDTRVDTTMPMVNMQMSIIHRRANKGMVVQLMHAQKQYMEMPVADGPTDQSVESLDSFEVKKLGKEKIAGHNTEHVQLTDKKSGATIDMWLSKEVRVADTLGMMSQGQGMEGAMVQALKKKGVEGWPLKVVAKQQGMTMTVETTKIEKKKLPADLFEVPKGYTKASMPAMPPGMPELTPEQLEMIQKMQQQQGR